jgi:hypothetical protein
VRIPGGGVRAPVGWGPSRRGHPLGGRHSGPLGGDAGQLPAADAATGGGRDRGHGPVAIRDASAAGPLLSRAGGAGPAPAAVGHRPGAMVRLPGVRALVAGAAAHAMMPLNVPPAGGVGLRRVSGFVVRRRADHLEKTIDLTGRDCQIKPVHRDRRPEPLGQALATDHIHATDRTGAAPQPRPPPGRSGLAFSTTRGTHRPRQRYRPTSGREIRPKIQAGRRRESGDAIGTDGLVSWHTPRR